MRNSRKKGIALIAVMLLVLIALTAVLASCVNGDADKVEKTVTLSLGDVVVENVKTTAEYLGELMKELRGDGKISYESEVGAYGEFVTSINGIELSDNQFVGVYTTIDDIKYVNKAYSTVFKDETYYSSNYGIDTLPLFEGKKYRLEISTY